MTGPALAFAALAWSVAPRGAPAPLAATPTPSRAAAPDPSGPFRVVDRIQAVVGDEIVLESEIDALVSIGFVPRLAGESDAAYRDRLLARRVDEILVDRQLRRTGGLSPDERLVETTFDELVSRAAAAGGFEAALVRARATRAEVRDWVRRSLALEQYVRERLSPTVKTPEDELRAFYEGEFRTLAKARGLDPLPPLAEVADQAREALRQRKLREAEEAWVAKLREETRVLIYRR